MHIREMNDYDLMRAILDSGRPVVTAFVERGSHGARSIETDLGDLARQMGDDAIFSVVDVSENPTITEKFGGAETPSVALFRDGKHLGTRSSDLGKGDLGEFIQQGLRKS